MYDCGMWQDSLELPAGLPVEAWEDEVEQSVWDAVVEALVAEVEAEQVARPGSLSGRRDGLATWTRDELLAEMSAAERESRSAQARVLAAVGELASRPMAGMVKDKGRPTQDEFTPDHVALAVGVSSGVSAGRRINEALLVRERYPLTFAALSAGLIGMTAVRCVLGEAGAVTEDRVEQVERRVLAEIGRPLGLRLGELSADQIADLPVEDVAALAGHATPGRVQKWVRRAVVQVDAAAARRVRAQAADSATVQLTPGAGRRDGVAGHLRPGGAGAGRLLPRRRPGQRPPARCGRRRPEPRASTRSQVFTDLLLGALPGADPGPGQRRGARRPGRRAARRPPRPGPPDHRAAAWSSSPR